MTLETTWRYPSNYDMHPSLPYAPEEATPHKPSTTSNITKRNKLSSIFLLLPQQWHVLVTHHQLEFVVHSTQNQCWHGNCTFAKATCQSTLAYHRQGVFFPPE
jgi:hypothetical protein